MKGYLVLDLSIKDANGFANYAENIPAFVKKHGGRYLVKGAVPEKMEGEWLPERLVILEFPSPDNARAFLADPDAQPLIALRHTATESRTILAEGYQ